MSTPAPAPGIRLKSQWFKASTARSPAQQAGVVGFNVWRIANHALKRMRVAGFDIEVGDPYFAFVAETMAFLIAVVDRLAFERMDAPAREAFTAALVRHCAGTLADNRIELIGPPDGAAAVRDAFVDLANERMPQYAEFGVVRDGAAWMPDFAFLRYLGSCLAPTLPAKDQAWVLDQVIAIEAPEAVRLAREAMLNLLAPPEGRVRRRGGLTGD